MESTSLSVIRKSGFITVAAILCGCTWAPSNTAAPAKPGATSSGMTIAAPAAPQAMTLYSINGNEKLHEGDAAPSEGTETAEAFHDYPILGKLQIGTPEQRMHLMNQLTDAIKKSDGTMAKCFWPRHGIRVVDNEKTVDYLICFECLQFHVYEDGKDERKAITRDPQEPWNRLLTAAGITLAKE